MSKRSNKVELQSRVNDVCERLLSGQKRSDIVHFATEAWGISERQVDDYLAKARDAIANSNVVHRDFEIARALVRMNQIFNKAESAEDYKTAILAQQEINKLLALYMPTRSEVSGVNGKPLEILVKYESPQDDDENDGE